MIYLNINKRDGLTIANCRDSHKDSRRRHLIPTENITRMTLPYIPNREELLHIVLEVATTEGKYYVIQNGGERGRGYHPLYRVKLSARDIEEYQKARSDLKGRLTIPS